MKTQFNWKTLCGLALSTLFATPTTVLLLGMAAQAETDDQDRSGYETRVERNQRLNRVTPSAKTQRAQPNDGINDVLSPNLSCGKTERTNNVEKGAIYGGGAGLLLLGGPVGALVGAGLGAAVQQEQNQDACAKD